MTEERDINEMRAKIIRLENNLRDTNDLALAQLEGEDMTEFGNIITYRHDLRVQIAALKARVAEAETEKSEEGPDVPNGPENWLDLMGHFLPYGEIVCYGDALYKVIIPHTAQADWTPSEAVSLFIKVSIAEYPEWVQPTGAHDAYNKGDKVAYDGKHWVSTADANVWQPGVYGWKEEA